MSVVLDATYAGEAFEVEVFHDGHIEFPGRNLQHEQAMAEFTDSESAVLQLYGRWKKLPTDAILDHLELPEDSIPRLVADYAEHVLHFYEEVHQGDHRPRDAIEAARKFVAGEVDLVTMTKAGEAARASRAVLESPAAWNAVEVTWNAVKVADWAARAAPGSWAAEAVISEAKSAVKNAKDAVACHASPGRTLLQRGSRLEWQQAHNAEVAWQVRRFVDCMEALGQGFDWPDIKVTP
jgi:hypothetical protein